MTIIDLEGRPIEVNDLQATIALVEEFISYETEDEIPSVQRFNERRKEYWKDFHTKLLAHKDYPHNKS